MILMTFINLQTSILFDFPNSLYLKSFQWRYFSLYSFAYLIVSAEDSMGSKLMILLISGLRSGIFIRYASKIEYINSSYEEY